MDKPIVIPNGTGPIRIVMITPTKFYDTVSNCKYNVPSFLSIGKVYARLAQDVHGNSTSYAATLYEIFLSGIDEMISNFNAAFYFAPRGEIAYYYKADYMHHDAPNQALQDSVVYSLLDSYPPAIFFFRFRSC